MELYTIPPPMHAKDMLPLRASCAGYLSGKEFKHTMAQD